MAGDMDSAGAAQVPLQHDAAVSYDSQNHELKSNQNGVDAHTAQTSPQTDGVSTNDNHDALPIGQQHEQPNDPVQDKDEHGDLAGQDHGIVSNLPPNEVKKKKKKNKTRSAGQKGLVRFSDTIYADLSDACYRISPADSRTSSLMHH